MAWNVFKKKTDEKTAETPQQVDVVPVEKTHASRSVAKKPGTFSVSADTIFIRPLATEKALSLVRSDVYVFEVATRATKIAIKKAFANLYGVMPTGVRVVISRGKVVRFGRREGRRKDSKKAYISVPKGTTIDF